MVSISAEFIIIMLFLIIIAGLYFYQRSFHVRYLKKKSLYLDMKTSIAEHEVNITKSKAEREEIKVELEKVKYSNELLEFIKGYIAQIVVIKFREFTDTYDIKNSTSQQYKTLIFNIATEIKESSNFYHKTIFPDKTIDKFIVDTVIMYVKDLLDKNVEDDPQFNIE